MRGLCPRSAVRDRACRGGAACHERGHAAEPGFAHGVAACARNGAHHRHRRRASQGRQNRRGREHPRRADRLSPRAHRVAVPAVARRAPLPRHERGAARLVQVRRACVPKGARSPHAPRVCVRAAEHGGRARVHDVESSRRRGDPNPACRRSRRVVRRSAEGRSHAGVSPRRGKAHHRLHLLHKGQRARARPLDHSWRGPGRGDAAPWL
eukprot:Amastigsp_a843565_216.p3 type:complete len:209 gc:universal Amastigsp_a843565_216:735-109(-)